MTPAERVSRYLDARDERVKALGLDVHQDAIVGPIDPGGDLRLLASDLRALVAAAETLCLYAAEHGELCEGWQRAFAAEAELERLRRTREAACEAFVALREVFD